MRHHIFQAGSSQQVALLIKTTAFNPTAMDEHYVTPLVAQGVSRDQIIAFDLEYTSANKAPVKLIKGYIEKLLPALKKQGVTHLFVADGNYFKVLAKKSKAEGHVGYALPCGIPGYEDMTVVLGLNYQALIYDPTQQSKLTLGINALASTLAGNYQVLGADIIHHAEYPREVQDIQAALQKLHQYPELTVDIEAFSLSFWKAGIATIGFAWNQHEGIAFPCDYHPFTDPDDVTETGLYGYFQENWAVRKLIKDFLTSYEGTITLHNAGFDIRTIIFVLWMNDLLDQKGLLTGLEILTRSFHDTKILTYLATNSTAGNELSLKKQAHEFAGNYAQEEIEDVRKIPLKTLLQYNLVDCLGTWYVRDKHMPTVIQDNQWELYQGLMLDSITLIVQMELTGLPMIRERIIEVKDQLEAKQQEYLAVIMGHPIIHTLNLLLQNQAMVATNAKLKVKQHPLTHFSGVTFNPNSGPQLQELLYTQMGLPVIDLTDTKQPATGADTIEKLINHTQNAGYREVLQALIQYGKVTKILSTFIPAFEGALDKDDGAAYLHGGYNLGGAVSGRLSSSKPNMQNIPAGSTYGKLIKSCFGAPKGWLFAGADFNSLEDYISALTTKDPNKLNVYLKGFDGHCLRAAYYFEEDLVARGIRIALDDPKSVNSIKTLAADLRQESKAPTFALTYQGTSYTLMNNLGWPEDKAKRVESNYHTLYKVSDQYVADRLAQACKDGYVEVAFGLRVRTPLLAQTILGTKRTPPAAAAEGRTAGNALGQSYGLLNNRAAVAFMKKVWKSPYRYDILPVALIHDAIYLMIRDRLDVVHWVNQNLIKEMQWQELPEIQHDEVKLGAELDIFWPTWDKPMGIPNNATPKQIEDLCLAHQEEINTPKT